MRHVYEICIAYFPPLKPVCFFDKNLFAATRRQSVQIKARRDSFTRSGLNESQVKDETYNGV